MTHYTAVHISGDLGQAIASTPGSSELVDHRGWRACEPSDVRTFFAFAKEIEEVEPDDLALLDARAISEKLAFETRKMLGLRLVLEGMDRRLSAGVRKASIRRAEGVLTHPAHANFAERRLVRVHDPEMLDPTLSSRVAHRDGAGRTGLIYDLISNPQLSRIENFITRRPDGDQILVQARQSGIVVDTTKAIHFQRPDLVERRLANEASSLTPLLVDLAAKFVPMALQARPAKRSTFRYIHRFPDVPSLYNLFGYPEELEIDADDRVKLKWLSAHAPHHRFYIGGGLNRWMAATGITIEEALGFADMAPDFVLESSDWTRVDAHWRQPPARVQFRKATKGDAQSLDRAGLVLAAFALAAQARGLGYGSVFDQLRIIPACYSLRREEMLKDTDVLEPQWKDLIRDILDGHPVTYAAALRTSRRTPALAVSADPQVLRSHGQRFNLPASLQEELDLTSPLRPLPALARRDDYDDDFEQV